MTPAELSRLSTLLDQALDLTEAEIAAALGVTDRTVRRDWEKARLLLLAQLQ